MQLPYRLAIEEKEEELLVPRRLEPAAATLAQPAVPRCIVHGAQHRCRAQRWLQPLADGGVIQAANIEGGVMGHQANAHRLGSTQERQKFGELRPGRHTLARKPCS